MWPSGHSFHWRSEWNLSSSFDRWDDLYSRLAVFSLYFASVLLCGMASMILVDVTLRYFFHSPLAASVEISQLIEPWVVFLPFAYTLTVGGHVQVTLVTMRLPAKWRLVCDIFAYIVDFLFFRRPVLLFVGSNSLIPLQSVRSCWPASDCHGGPESWPCLSAASSSAYSASSRFSPP